MRRVVRAELPSSAQAYLNERQAAVDLALDQGAVSVESKWKAARPTERMETVLKALRGMTGPHERCMYCVDSHACDIEHFWPKSRYPNRSFDWVNLLLCCTECGRFKGNQFPLAGSFPLLVDPSAEDPWLHLDFDPDTGNLVARFDKQANDWSVKGIETVKVLQLDRREALGKIYKRTLLRLSRIVESHLKSGAIEAPSLLVSLRDADDHGLLRWCFGPSGRTAEPFSTLHRLHPQEWADCEEALLADD